MVSATVRLEATRARVRRCTSRSRLVGIPRTRSYRVLVDTIETTHAPHPIGPYSQAVRVGDFLFCSGQVGLDPGTGKLVSGGVKAEAERIMENVRELLSAAGVNLEHVVKTTIFLADMADFSDVNTVYGGYFSGSYPARTTVAVAALPAGASVEIDVIARM
ncbi:RidA family protein [bacterium]|nr:MAG: RidA family protein [bacterium]